MEIKLLLFYGMDTLEGWKRYTPLSNIEKLVAEMILSHIKIVPKTVCGISKDVGIVETLRNHTYFILSWSVTE